MCQRSQNSQWKRFNVCKGSNLNIWWKGEHEGGKQCAVIYCLICKFNRSDAFKDLVSLSWSLAHSISEHIEFSCNVFKSMGFSETLWFFDDKKWLFQHFSLSQFVSIDFVFPMRSIIYPSYAWHFYIRIGWRQTFFGRCIIPRWNLIPANGRTDSIDSDGFANKFSIDQIARNIHNSRHCSTTSRTTTTFDMVITLKSDVLIGFHCAFTIRYSSFDQAGAAAPLIYPSNFRLRFQLAGILTEIQIEIL